MDALVKKKNSALSKALLHRQTQIYIYIYIYIYICVCVCVCVCVSKQSSNMFRPFKNNHHANIVET